MNRTGLIVAGMMMVLVLMFLQGCATTGNESMRNATEESVKTQVTEGKTTKGEVKQAFGSPLSTSYTSEGLEIWKYELSKVSADATAFIPIVNIFASSASGTKKELTILFDDKGVVKKYNMSESPITIRRGLANQ